MATQPKSLYEVVNEETYSEADAILDFYEVWTSEPLTASAPVSGDWEGSVATWGRRGLTRDDFESFLNAIIKKGDDLPSESRWKYFCGCAWTRIRQGASVRFVEEN